MKRSGFIQLTYEQSLEKRKLSQSKARKKVKKPKVPKKTTVKNRLDKQWSLKIRSKGKCEVCGKTADECQLHPHHIIGRQDLRTRWDVRNGACICAEHHTMGKISAHGNPLWFHEWLEDNRADDVIYLKEIMKIPPAPYSVQDYLKIEEHLKSL